MQSNTTLTKTQNIRFSYFDKEVIFYLPDVQDHIQKIIRRERKFYELKMLEDIYQRVPAGSTIIDVGANIGNHTIFFGKICDLHVIAIEPFYHCFEILKNNIKLNKIEENVITIQKAAGRKKGKGNCIVIDSMNYGSNKIQPKEDGAIDIITLDELILDNNVSTIKIDVEGMEYDVLQGATELIRRFKPLIYIEVKNAIESKKIKTLLSSLGYSHVVEFNWTPTFLFMHSQNSSERFAILNCRIDFLNNQFKHIYETLNRDLLGKLNNTFQDKTKEIGDRLVEIDKINKTILLNNEKIDHTIDHTIAELNMFYSRLAKIENLINETNDKIENQNQRIKIHLDWTQDRLIKLGDRLSEQFQTVKQQWIWTEERIKKNYSNSHVKLKEKLKKSREYNELLENSYRFKIGNAFVETLKHPIPGILKLPYRLTNLCSNYLKKNIRFKNTNIIIKYKNKFLVAKTKKIKNGDIVASLASIPQRVGMLQDTISSLYHQVDRLHVYLNNYDSVPEFLLRGKITVCRSQDYGDIGDAGKYFWESFEDRDGYRFICDDDLVFPPDYVATMLTKLQQYNNSVILGIHGILLKQPLTKYYDFRYRHITHYESECKRDYNVHVLGTGAVAFHASCIRLDRSNFMFRNMADIWFALEAQRQKVPMVCIQRLRHWIIQNKDPQSSLSIYNHSYMQKNSALDTSMVQSHVVRKNHPFTINVFSSDLRKKRKIVLGVTTYNRCDYLRSCLESFLQTRNNEHEWVVIVADDGSTDDTLEYLEDLNFPHELHIIKNNRRYAGGQTNTIFELSQAISFDIGFKVDDDLVFKKKGWDSIYIEAIEKSGWQHLVYRNKKVYADLRRRDEPNFQSEPVNIDSSGLCEAVADTRTDYGTGPLFTFTPEIIQKVGYSDEPNFPIRGQWHVDYHIRCCRAGFNVPEYLYDAVGSNEYLEVQNNLITDYRCAIPWGEEYAKTKEPAELARRQRVMSDESRIYISLPEKVTPPRATSINEFFDRIYVLNLDRRPDRWQRIKTQAGENDVNIQRFSAVDGSQEPFKSKWENYFCQELISSPEGIRKVNNSFEYYLDYESDMARVAYLEGRNQKKAIQSSGAWGYLCTMINVLEEAIEEDLDSILVLDDDAIFHKSINELFREYVQQVPDDWKIIQLGTLQYHWYEKWITWHSANLYKCNGTSIGSHAVGLHHTVYPLLLNYCYRFDMAYDEGPLHKAKRIFADQSFTFYPNLIIQDTRESDINSSKVQKDEGQKEKNVYRWNLPDYGLKSVKNIDIKKYSPQSDYFEGQSKFNYLINDKHEVIFNDNLKRSWYGWLGVQKVKLGLKGILLSLQNTSTPGITKKDLKLEPNTYYRFSVTGSFQPKSQKVYWIVTDIENQIDLCPANYFSGIYPENKPAQTIFRTLQLTKKVNIKIVIENPYEGDKLVFDKIKLEAIPIKEAFSVALHTLDYVNESNNNAFLASIPQRVGMLQDTISSLYHQVDRLHVYLNNYDSVPEFLLRGKITVCRSQDYGDIGDAGKYFWESFEDRDGYRFICDDDLVFPPDYVATMLTKLQQYNNSVILGIHGILLKQPLNEYYNPSFRHITRYPVECKRDYNVHVLGTGAVAFHASCIRLDRSNFMFRNMADIWFALEAQRQKVPMVCIQRLRHWIIQNKDPQSSLSIYNHSYMQKNSALDTSMVQSHVVRKNHPFTINVFSSDLRKKRKIVLGVTTYNRCDYLRSCLESFLQTRNNEHEWVVIVADDGSTDDTLEYLEDLNFPHELHIIKNNRRYAGGQTNTIFELSQAISFDIGFKVDDDLVFKKKGWDSIYIEAIEKSGWQHLVYRNKKVYADLRRRDEPNFQSEPVNIDSSGLCEAVADTRTDYGTGPLFTFTPEIIQKVGYSDEPNFPIRGQWHVDYHIRCCRAGFNVPEYLYDAVGSNEYLEVQNNLITDYRCAIPWGEEYAKTKEPAELARRQRVMSDESRIYISLPEKVTPPRATSINEFFDRIYVLNLDRRPDRWQRIKTQAGENDVNIQRFSAVDGSQEPFKSKWENYFCQELISSPEGIRKVNNSFEYYLDYESDMARVAYLEGRNQKKAIQSSGAWGYLCTMINVLEEAIEEDLDSILVLDDDAIFHKSINELFREYVQQVPDDWKIIQLGTLQYHWYEKWITWHSANLYKCNGTSIGSHAVGLHHTVYPLLLNYCYRFDMAYDEGPLHKAKRIFADQSFTFYPNLIIQDTRESDINSSKVQKDEGQKEKNVYRWNLPDYKVQCL